MHRVASGNFIVNITFGWEHAVAITDESDAGKLVSHRFPQFSFAEGMVPEFFRYVIADEKFRHHLWLASPGGAGRNRVLKLDEMLNYIMKVPSRDEQIKIAEFFRQLDHLITLHQKKCFEWKKRGFSSASISWEQRKLGDHCDMFNGDRGSKYPNAQDMVANGIPFINAGDLVNGHVNLETADKITREKYGDLGGAKLQLGDIVYCLRGTLGKNAYIDNFTEGTVASSLVAIRPKNIDGRYLFHVLNSDIEYRQRIVRDEGAAQPNLSAKSVSEFIMPIPDIEEQKRFHHFWMV